jgi:hypothetical protein
LPPERLERPAGLRFHGTLRSPRQPVVHD